ncbi:uncharacterized protein LOC125384426 [Haliotis rufescens]|uniref:uncharacterized protein LOC125384426 n=1 Tax=Haliotis rufescens TaxID=6454 RepID=UPI00201E871F|nr:uncharacterized protein LOC125384426 [Haliotis rufescens]
MYQREVAYNSTIQELYGRIRNVTNDTDLNRKQLKKWEFDDSVIRWKSIALAVASLFVVSIFLVIVLGVKFCRYRTLLKRKGNEQNNLVEDQTYGIGRDATELKCLITVADNGGNRDSQVSGDSALDSTASYSDSSSSLHNTQSPGGFSVPVPEVGEPRSGDQSNTRLLAANNSNSNNSAFLTTAEQHTFRRFHNKFFPPFVLYRIRKLSL